MTTEKAQLISETTEETQLVSEGRACGFVVGVIVCALLVALLYFGLQWALSGYPP